METLFQEDCLTMEEILVEGYEKVYKIEDSSVGLKAIICLHNLTLGVALGGTRIYPYATFEDALTDVKRLAKGIILLTNGGSAPNGQIMLQKQRFLVKNGRIIKKTKPTEIKRAV